ncbi:helix-turn-helix domain-containing protein [Clostridium botulinum]|uniref:Carbohydrate diacid regulator n=1 Tax=Clostridium botulinum TaxID=1491 RepID=A0A6B4JJK9_CLOBO|nr:sugar diacid recognition domain-containing protein [Clostridium botulinum]MBY6760605.1 helix-turn-helix domain-containing protein [Clostridium botulinum]MBY6919512.1 helix-turn-helix domain-containing protein [Clostridium botulinum]MCR1130391.1 helix-turn-helix domain-containing protein [Clostridium botulinum]NFH69007.1 carbohydrate diacid regulator [Clostridium botulinum]NFJ56855.1 carbohydrate diacid regulator [Clostridium botulinum]
MLSKELAQSIVNKVMEVIPYNVNIMDEDGIIIGSGDVSRIGSLHEGALNALKNKKTVEIFKDYEYAKAGVNIPILFRNKIMGVIGITGEPKIVSPFGKIVSITAELLISQEYTLNQHIIKQKLIEEFIYEWLNINEEYTEEFVQRGMSLEIDIRIKRFVIIVEYDKSKLNEVNKFIDKNLKENEYSINISSNKIALLLKSERITNHKIIKFYDKIQGLSIKIGVGRVHNAIINSLIEGVNALNIGNKLYEDKSIYVYDEIKFLHKMSLLINGKYEKEIIDDILEEAMGKELLETFLIYMKNNGERAKTANEIHIHRNTLNYRLEKIEEVTGLKFNDYLDLFQLITAYVGYKLYY